MMGPPTEAPNWFRRSTSVGSPCRSLKYELASSAVLRRNSYTVPCSPFVPVRVTRSTWPPAVRPYSALALLVMTRNSWRASGFTGELVSSPRGITGSEMSMPSWVVVMPRPRSPLM